MWATRDSSASDAMFSRRAWCSGGFMSWHWGLMEVHGRSSREQLVAADHRKSMTRVPKPCCIVSHSLTQLEGKTDGKADGKALAHESCQTALSMAEMQVVSSLAQLVYCEPNTPALRGGASPPVVFISTESSPASERSAPTSVTCTSSYPPATGKCQVCPNASVRIGVQPSPPKGPGKAKWNSDVRCNWPLCPPSSPTRVGGGGPIPTLRKPATAPEAKTRNVGVMTFPAINAGELIKKMEALEIELDVHVGNERQLLSINEQLRKRLEECLRELNDAGMMNIQLDNLNDEMEKILQLLRHLSERNTALEKEKAQVHAKLQREAALHKLQASRMLMHYQLAEDHDVDLCDAECQTICFCQQVDTRKRRRERRRWSMEEEPPPSNHFQSTPTSPSVIRKADFEPES